MTRRERLQRLLAERQRRQQIVITLLPMDDPEPAPTPASEAPSSPERQQAPPSASTETSGRCAVCGLKRACGASHAMRP